VFFHDELFARLHGVFCLSSDSHLSKVQWRFWLCA